MVVADTPKHVRRRVASVFVGMSGADRVRCANDMADEVREVAIAGIRARQPDLSDREVAIEWLRLLRGGAVVDRVALSSSSS